MTSTHLRQTDSHTAPVVIALVLIVSPMAILAQVPSQLRHDNPRSFHPRPASRYGTTTSPAKARNQPATPVETVARSFQTSAPALEIAQTGNNHTTAPRSAQQPLRRNEPLRTNAETIRLRPRRPLRNSDQRNLPETNRPEFTQTLITVASSLAIVLGLFFLVIWLFRRTAPRQSVRLPGEVFEFLGRAPLAGRQEMQLLRLGHKLLLLAVTPTGAQTLTEITDPDEVDRLSGICLNHSPSRIAHSFRSIRETQQSPIHLPAYDTPNLGSELRG